jgi:membrane-bound lytic murein transglycosylase D
VPPVISFFEADTVLVDQKVSLRDVASATDIPLDLLTYLNPVYKKGVIPDGDESFVLRLPVNKINTYLANTDKIFSSPDASSITADEASISNPSDYISKTIKVFHVVKRGEPLASIADDFNCSVSDLKKWNKIKGKKVFKGQKLAIYTTIHQRIEPRAEVKKKTNDTTLPTKTVTTTDTVNQTQSEQEIKDKKDTSVSVENKETAEAKKIVWHLVQPGDTLWNIAQRYTGVTVEELKSINHLKTNALKPGTKLKIKISG